MSKSSTARGCSGATRGCLGAPIGRNGPCFNRGWRDLPMRSHVKNSTWFALLFLGLTAGAQEARADLAAEIAAAKADVALKEARLTNSRRVLVQAEASLEQAKKERPNGSGRPRGPQSRKVELAEALVRSSRERVNAN